MHLTYFVQYRMSALGDHVSIDYATYQEALGCFEHLRATCIGPFDYLDIVVVVHSINSYRHPDHPGLLALIQLSETS